jgi:hypothetical protein
MLEVNLYQNHNLTLADIYRYQESLEVEYDITPLASEKPLSFAKKFLLIFVAALLSFALIATVFIIVYDPFYKPPVYVDEVTAPVVTPPADPLEGYVKVQVIEFTPSNDNTTAPVRDTTPDMEVLPSLAPADKAKPAPKPAAEPAKPTSTATPAKPAPIKPAPAPVVTTYSLQVSGVSPAEYDILRNIAATHGVRASITHDLSSIRTVWSVYTPSADTGVFIEDVEVAKLSEFDTRELAIKYAETRGVSIIIRAESKSVALYDVELCCMSSNEAKISAQQSGITDKVFRVVPH